MTRIQASCLITGKRFSPAAFAKLSTVKLVDAEETGQIGKTGAYRGKPVPSGSATIEVSDKAEGDWALFDDLVKLVEGCAPALRAAGADEITLLCSVFHDGQCNFGFSKTQLKKLAELEIDFKISCYDDQLK